MAATLCLYVSTKRRIRKSRQSMTRSFADANAWRGMGYRDEALVPTRRYAHREGRALVESRFHRYRSSQHLRVLLHDVKPQSAAAELAGVRAVRLLEHVEDDRQAPFRYAGAGVGNLKLEILVDARGNSHGAAFGKLDRVVNELLKDLGKKYVVGDQARQALRVFPDQNKIFV